MYLIDTNVWLERLLDQDRTDEVAEFFDRSKSEHLFITDFAFHSIGIVMTKLDRKDDFLLFVKDAFIDGAVGLIHLEPEDSPQLIGAIEKYHLDFDDAYHYIAAQKYSLTIVSFDSDFDQTPQRRKSPAEIK